MTVLVRTNEWKNYGVLFQSLVWFFSIFCLYFCFVINIEFFPFYRFFSRILFFCCCWSYCLVSLHWILHIGNHSTSQTLSNQSDWNFNYCKLLSSWNYLLLISCFYIYLEWLWSHVASDVPRDFLGRPISAGYLGRGEREVGCDAALWVQNKALVETLRQSSRKLQGFSILKSLLIKIYRPQPVTKLIQHVFFKNLA